MADPRQMSRRRMLIRTGDCAAHGDGVRGVGDHGEVLTGTENPIAIIFWMLVLQSILGLVPALAVWRWPAADAWPWIIMVAFGDTFSHDCSERALRHADATVVVPMHFIRVPLTALAGWWLYAERFNMRAVLGATLTPAEPEQRAAAACRDAGTLARHAVIDLR